MKRDTYDEKRMMLKTEYQGVMKIDDIIRHYVKILDDNSLPRDLKVLIDCSSAQFDVNVDEIGLATEVVKKALLKYNSIREAILVDKPHETVIATLFEKYNSALESYSFSVFSTETSARNWLS